jgi:hypothetical protein
MCGRWATRTSPTPEPASTPKPNRDVPEEGLEAGDVGTVVFVHENTAERPPVCTLELSSVAEDTLEEATVEAGAARVAGDAKIRASVVSPDEDEDPFPIGAVEPTG